MEPSTDSCQSATSTNVVIHLFFNTGSGGDFVKSTSCGAPFSKRQTLTLSEGVLSIRFLAYFKNEPAIELLNEKYIKTTNKAIDGAVIKLKTKTRRSIRLT
ncbi:TPA: hypothetical protein QH398_004382 [Escherichia coli]|nr:hypothetical protein [Escherichia coli]